MGELESELQAPRPVRAHLLPKSGSLITIYASSNTDRVRAPQATRFSSGEKNLLAGFLQPSMSHNLLPYQAWGERNDFPLRATQLNLKNPISSQLMQTKTDFAIGKKLVTYYERVDDKGDSLVEDIVFIPEIDDWHEENETIDKLSRSTLDYFMVGNGYWILRPNRARNKIVRLDHIDPNLVRVGHVQNLEVLDYALADFLSGVWRDLSYLPKFDSTDPFAYANSVMQVMNYVPGSYFYGIPDWIGAEDFIRLLNDIPKFHTSGLDRSFFLRWHIQIPEDYFHDQGLTEKEMEEAEDELKNHFDNFLAGAENNGKSIITKFKTDHVGKPVEGIKIEPLKPELYDKAFLSLYDQGMMAVCSAHGIDPSLAGVILNGQLSAGSHLRNGYNMFELLKVPRTRRNVLQPMYKVHYANKWHKTYRRENQRLRYGFIGSQITKLDENSEGAKDITQ